jgi:hypothetical protein
MNVVFGRDVPLLLRGFDRPTGRTLLSGRQNDSRTSREAGRRPLGGG